jgi:predicted choloylglycine hydrolase
MKQFPCVRASGTHYGVGRTIGKKMQVAIGALLAANRKLCAERFGQYLGESKKFLFLAEQYFPKYVEELRGMADGAGVPFDELFLSNNPEVAGPDSLLLESYGCTTVAVPSGAGYIVGHNEDWVSSSRSPLYLLDATVDGINIFGINYPNTLIGDAIAVNGHGLVQAIDELFHHDAKLGVPKHFISRAVLDCKRLEEAETLMKTVPRAAGWNHVLIQGERLWNIESCAKEYVIEKATLEKHVHTNHYITKLKMIDLGNPASEKRYERAKQQLERSSTVEDIKRLLSDRQEPGICREATVGSVIFDMANKTAHVACGQPTPEGYVEYHIDHVFV